MACVAEPEVQFAQRLASNEKPARKKALKKLRTYISARSRTHTGFSEEELLKLWKGLFYCLWMQDKPLLQEELSTQISGLVHHFHNFSAQLLFLRTFLTTVKREWTGIDRLRMDKYFQLVRFVFRQMFELLQRSRWDSSYVDQFLELLSSELLQQAVAPPMGLQLHVLDLYLRELAVVGAHELTADQNLIFIEPFMKTAAKTKDRFLFTSICSSIFSTIIDQAPFAIQELLDELEQDSDSGQASEEHEKDQEEYEEELKIRLKKSRSTKAKATEQINGTNGEDMEESEEEDDGLSDSEQPVDEDVGPVLQFDYGAVADKLLEVSSRGNTPSRNRQRLYKIVRVLRDLSQGSFPQDEYPEEVSTDEDDDDFGSRKRMKRRHTEEPEGPEEELEQKPKGKKKKSQKPSAEPTSAQPTDAQPSGPVSGEEVTKKKRKKRKKKKSQSPDEPTNSNPTAEVQPQDQPQDLSEDQPKDQPEPTLTTPSQKNPAPVTSPQSQKKQRKKAKKGQNQEQNQEQQNGPIAEEQSVAPPPVTPQIETSKHPAEEPMKDANKDARDATPITQKKKKKKKGTDDSELQHQEVMQKTLAEDEVQPERKVNKKKAVVTMDTGAEEELQQECESPPPATSKKVTKKRKAAGQKSTHQPNPEEDVEVQKKKRKKVIPVEFEYEAEEVQQETTSMPAEPPQTPQISRTQKLQRNHKGQKKESEFVSFQNSRSPPAPLFCRALFSKTMSVQPKSNGKKVHFGLKNNRTAEFRRTDRSLLLSSEGLSRVPFDPEQKPKCGVLKSPPTPAPKQKRKKSGARVRPTAADFF